MPAELAEGLLKRSPLEAAGYKKFTRLDQILLRLFFSPALRSDVQWRAMRNVPATFLFEDANELKLCLDLDLHILDTQGKQHLESIGRLVRCQRIVGCDP